MPRCDNSVDSCEAELSCSSSTCMLKCSSNSTCVPPADCDDGVCSTPSTGLLLIIIYIVYPSGMLVPSYMNCFVVGDFDCLVGSTCTDTFAICNTNTGRCECTVGTFYSSERQRCEWAVDQACMNCPPCVTSCPSENMICNKGGYAYYHSLTT